jgi:L-alanine-DL-glutamate epimerase-like enolase superfamily enzyme
MSTLRYRIERVEGTPLSVPLVEPFVISSGRVDTTPNVLVEVEVVDLVTGARATGLGEASTLHPVTKETQGSVLGAFAVLQAPAFALKDLGMAVEWGQDRSPGPCVAAGIETALVDAFARLAGVSARVFLGGEAGARTATIATDITIPIGDPGHMAKLAKRWRAKGFRCFKVKVGKDLDEDLRALELIHEVVPDATYRIDANAAFTVAEALALARSVKALGLQVECYEQPCARLALEAMAEVAAELETPVIADESVATLGELERVVKAKAADGINLKLVKSGGPLQCFVLGQAARRHGLQLMVGGMVETRLGMTAAAQLAAALGGVEYPDLDTAWLLADDPFTGGYTAEGPLMTLSDAAGLGIAQKL